MSRRRNIFVDIVLVFCTIVEYFRKNIIVTNAFTFTHRSHHQTRKGVGMITRTTTTTGTTSTNTNSFIRSSILKLSSCNDDFSSSSSSFDQSFESFSVQSTGRKQQQQQLKQQQQQQQQQPTEEYNDFLPNPNTHWTAQDVVQGCMETLLHNPIQGLEVCYSFSSDRCRAAIGGSLDKFNEYATNPVFQYLVNCNEYKFLHIGPIIPNTLTRGAMQTCLISVVQYHHVDKSNTNTTTTTTTSRNFLWTLQQERRPPNQGCWMVHEVLFVKNAYMQTL